MTIVPPQSNPPRASTATASNRPVLQTQILHIPSVAHSSALQIRQLAEVDHAPHLQSSAPADPRK
jgi:hypothetical protein